MKSSVAPLFALVVKLETFTLEPTSQCFLGIVYVLALVRRGSAVAHAERVERHVRVRFVLDGILRHAPPDPPSFLLLPLLSFLLVGCLFF